jgi:hypothetical protein
MLALSLGTLDEIDHKFHCRPRSLGHRRSAGYLKGNFRSHMRHPPKFPRDNSTGLAAACLMYAYLLNVKLCIPTATVSSALTAIAAVLAGLQAESIRMEEIHEKGRPFHVRGVTDC